MAKRARPVRVRSPAQARLAGCNPAAASRGREPDAGKAHRASSSGGCGSASNAGRGLRIFSTMERRNTRSGPSCRGRHKRRLACRTVGNAGNAGNPPDLPGLAIGISLAESAGSPSGSSDRHGLQLGQISPSPQFPPRETVRRWFVSPWGPLHFGIGVSLAQIAEIPVAAHPMGETAKWGETMPRTCSPSATPTARRGRPWRRRRRSCRPRSSRCRSRGATPRAFACSDAGCARG